MNFTTIKQIAAHQFVGNHHSDSEAFNAIDEFVNDMYNSEADRAEALRTMTDCGMGCGREEEVTDAELLKAYYLFC